MSTSIHHVRDHSFLLPVVSATLSIRTPRSPRVLRSAASPRSSVPLTVCQLVLVRRRRPRFRTRAYTSASMYATNKLSDWNPSKTYVATCQSDAHVHAYLSRTRSVFSSSRDLEHSTTVYAVKIEQHCTRVLTLHAKRS